MTNGPALAEGGRAVILVHGRNASPRNILDLVPRLNRPLFTYVAPAAANSTWYPYSFLAERGTNEPHLSSALRRLGTVLESIIATGVPATRVVLMGFSQGACLATEFAYQNPTRYGGLVAFSGGLIGPAGIEWPSTGSFDGTPVFFGCSDIDPHVPKQRVEESAGAFTRMGALVTTRFYAQMGHLVNDDEVGHAQLVLDQV